MLSRNTGYSRRYGINPYREYDDINKSPFLLDSEPDPRLPPMERVAVLKTASGHKAYPFSILKKQVVLHDNIDGEDVVFFSKKNTRSPLDRSYIGESRLIISTQAFYPALDGRRLKFHVNSAGDFTDSQTGSVWLITGESVSGPLKGKRLDAIATEIHFAFAWLIFRPDTIIFQ